MLSTQWKWALFISAVAFLATASLVEGNIVGALVIIGVSMGLTALVMALTSILLDNGP